MLTKVQAFHFKLGQGAKTGTGGHLPGPKVKGRIAEVRGLPEGTPAVSPSTFPDWHGVDDFRRFADEVRDRSGGIPIGVKLSAQHIESDIDAALEIGVDYIILDGRGGGTGAAPLLFRDNISVPTIPALARARRHLDRRKRRDVTLVVTGGLRDAADFAKALALGADAVAIANSAIQAIGCLGMRACHTNNCPVGIATQKEHLRARLPVDEAAHRLEQLPARDGRAHAGARPRVRPRPPLALLARRPHHVRPRHGRAHRHRVRRRAMTDPTPSDARLAQGRRRSTRSPTAG